MSNYKWDGTLSYAGDKYEFGACPNPNCKRFNKPFASIRSASGHFSHHTKAECARINFMMQSAKASGEEKVVAGNPKRLKVDMPDEAQFGGAPPIFTPKLPSAGYRPLYTQTSSRVPDISIPLTPGETTDAQLKIDDGTDGVDEG